MYHEPRTYRFSVMQRMVIIYGDSGRDTRRRIPRWAKRLYRLATYFFWLFSFVCTFLGIATDRAIEWLVGPIWLGRFIYFRSQVLGMTQEQARWILVIVGDLSFAAAAFLFFFVYYADKMSKTFVTTGEFSGLQDKLKNKERELENKMDFIEETLRRRELDVSSKLAEARRKEAKARKLHNNAYQLLQKVRKEKGQNEGWEDKAWEHPK